jgi:hypothetical protein
MRSSSPTSPPVTPPVISETSPLSILPATAVVVTGDTVHAGGQKCSVGRLIKLGEIIGGADSYDGIHIDALKMVEIY